MKSDMQKLAISLFLVAILAACVSGTPQVVEVTRLAPQTVEVIRLVPQTAIITRTPKPTAIAIALDTGYYEGMVVITQYFTLLGHGFHKEAYQLLSSGERSQRSFEDYAMNIFFENVEIVVIKPVYLDSIQRGSLAYVDPPGEKEFYVQVRIWGKDKATNGALRVLFVNIIQENGEWRIDSMGTSP